MVEIFKDIKGYEGLYQVSNLGRVKSVKKERIRKTSKYTGGYLQVILCKDGKITTKKVHRLVADAFLPNPLNLPQVNHKDENKENNCVDNLEWCDCKYNINYGTALNRMAEKLTNRKDLSKKVLCVETGIIYPSSMEAQRQIGINHSHIIDCCKGKRKTAGKFHWKYSD